MSITISKDVYVDVDVDLSDFEISDLIEELERQDYIVTHKDDFPSLNEQAKDQLYKIYRDYTFFGKDSVFFEKGLKDFFEDHLNTLLR